MTATKTVIHRGEENMTIFFLIENTMKIGFLSFTLKCFSAVKCLTHLY